MQANKWSYFLIFIICIYSYLYFLYLYFNEKNLKPCKMFIYVCMYACVYKFHSETQVPLLLFRRSTHSNPPWMFFECRHRGWWYNTGNVWEGIGVQLWFLKKSFKLWFYNLFIYLLKLVKSTALFFLKKTLSFMMFDLSEDSNQNEKQQLAI